MSLPIVKDRLLDRTSCFCTYSSLFSKTFIYPSSLSSPKSTKSIGPWCHIYSTTVLNFCLYYTTNGFHFISHLDTFYQYISLYYSEFQFFFSQFRLLTILPQTILKVITTFKYKSLSLLQLFCTFLFIDLSTCIHQDPVVKS